VSLIPVIVNRKDRERDRPPPSDVRTARDPRSGTAEAGKDRRDLGDPGASALADSARRHAERAPDVSRHRDRQAVRRQRAQRAISKLVRRAQAAEALQTARAAQGGGSGAARSQCVGEGGHPMTRRREFISLLGGAAVAWPLAARAQPTAMPVIGVLGPGSAESNAFRVTPFRQGLNESGYVLGQNLMVEFRWAESQYDRLPALAADLAQRQVAVIVTIANVASLAAKAATTTIPIVFTAGADPVQLGLVASLNRPGGNATGVTFFTTSLEPKKLELLRELVPAATVIALLINSTGPNAETTLRSVRAAADALGLQIQVVNASSAREFDAAIATAVGQGARALFVGADPLFTDERDKLVPVIARHAIPAIYSFREATMAGGLMSYGISFAEVYRQAAMYTARILKGTKPLDLPVIRTTKFELVINLKTAKALGLTVPQSLQVAADEVIE